MEKCCLKSAYLQWLCHSGERLVARGPVVFITFYCIFNLDFFVFFCHLLDTLQWRGMVHGLQFYLACRWWTVQVSLAYNSVGSTTDLYTYSFVSRLIPLRSQILPRSRPNAALALAVLVIDFIINVHNARQCASKVGELVYHLQSLTFHCDGRRLVRLLGAGWYTTSVFLMLIVRS